MKWAAALLLIAACHRATAPPPSAASDPAPTGAPDARPPQPDASPPTRPAPAQVSAGDTCAQDDDCVVTNFPGCCACPQCSIGPPVALSKLAERRAEGACAVASCDMRGCDIGGMCPPGESAAHFVARCTHGTCAMARR